jgi:hypothetical protein
LSQLREKLSVVTKAWFAQKDFRDVSILNDFQDSLGRSFKDVEDERDQFFGLSLRDMIHEFKHQTLVLFKCLLLQPKVRSHDRLESCAHLLDALFRYKL